ncbi:MAG TPA: guanylate kinase [Flammeovirgaceae bacterium]|nr:guanylate kinase [Flammeovirgaceae bacterium]
MSYSGKAVIFSAPSGSGKTTIVRHLLKVIPGLEFSISACTRDKRGRTEQDGKDYYFLSVDEFKRKIDNGEFIEWEEVYPGNYYGTLKSEIARIWQAGKAVIFDVDVKGGVNLKNYFKEKALAVFVKVPSLEVLAERLRARGTEDEESLSERLYKAQFELQFEDRFDVTIVNDELPRALQEAEKLVREFLDK